MVNHIAIYLPSLRGGGAERVMVTLANAFASMGYQVDLVLAKAEGPYLSEVAAHVRIVDLAKSRVFASLIPLAQYMRREQPDAMLSAMIHCNIISIAARMLARVKMRLIVSERNVLSSAPAGTKTAVIHRLMTLLYPRSDGVIAVSEGIAAELRDKFGLAREFVVAIPNPVDLDRIGFLASERVNHPWISDRSAPVVLAVGRLTPQKDYPTLLRAFAILRQLRTVKLIVLGEGAERAALEELVLQLGIAEDVDFLGFKENPFCWMSASDLFVMSSAWEGHPGALLQAMACGAQIVSTNCQTGPQEILEDGRWGHLVPVGDEAALANAMHEALDGVVKPDTKVRAAQFRVEHIARLYLDMLTV